MRNADGLDAVRQTVKSLAEQLGLLPAEQANFPSTPDRELDRLVTAKAWKQANDLVNNVFNRAMFCSPAWNILLDLYINESEGRPIAVTSVCLAAGAPLSTAFRYVAQMQDRGWVERKVHPKDKRVHNLWLTAVGLNLVNKALDGVTTSNEQLGIGHLRTVR